MRTAGSAPRRWRPLLRGGSGQLYLQIVDAIASDIQSGVLSTSDRLPAQRELAQRLKINYATVSRAYQEAQRRGLIYSRVGQGTFVRRPAVGQLSKRSGQTIVDMSMNLPPEPQDPALWAQLEAQLAALQPRLRELLRYEPFGGNADAREAGVRWLAQTTLEADRERLLVCPGAQAALHACLSLLAKPGDVALCEEITYPGLRALARQLGVRLVGLPMDEEGITCEALARACAEHHPKLLYCNPTLQNPTTLTTSSARRDALIASARRHGLSIVEDDAYGVLPSAPIAPIAQRAPDITYHVSGFAKCLGPGLRIAYLVAPDARRAERLAAILRATTIMASPLTAALATECVHSGLAAQMLRAIRAESVARQGIAREELQGAEYAAHPEGFHLWLRLPARWSSAAFSARLLAEGIRVVASEAFAESVEPPPRLRVCLGGSSSRDEMRALLRQIFSLLRDDG